MKLSLKNVESITGKEENAVTIIFSLFQKTFKRFYPKGL